MRQSCTDIRQACTVIWKRWNAWVSTSLFGILLCGAAVCQSSKETFPLPEYYGTYAIAGNKLIDLQSPSGSRTVSARVGIRSTAVQVCTQGGSVVAIAKEVSIPEVPGDVQFLVFLQNSGPISAMTAAGYLNLNALSYVRNAQVTDCVTRRPALQTGVENAWDDYSAGSTSFRMKPVPNHQEMVIAVPSAPLGPGLYAFLEDLSRVHSYLQFLPYQMQSVRSALTYLRPTACSI